MDFAVLALISLFAYFIGATAGFGDAVIIVTLTLATGIYAPNALEFIVPTVVVLAPLISLYLVVRHHDAIDRKLLLRKILPVAGIGLPIGMLLFNVVKSSVLVIVLGAVVVFFSTLELILVVRSGDNARMPMSDLQADFCSFPVGSYKGSTFRAVRSSCITPAGTSRTSVFSEARCPPCG